MGDKPRICIAQELVYMLRIVPRRTHHFINYTLKNFLNILVRF